MDIEGENICHVCGKKIYWLKHIYGGGTEVVTFGDRQEAELIAKKSIMTSKGKKVIYDVIVKCPKCHVKNKFEETR